MTIRHRLIKFFGGRYYKFKGSKIEESYWYPGTLKRWFEEVKYKYRKKKLHKRTRKYETAYEKHRTQGKRLSDEHKLLMDAYINFK